MEVWRVMSLGWAHLASCFWGLLGTKDQDKGPIEPLSTLKLHSKPFILNAVP